MLSRWFYKFLSLFFVVIGPDMAIPTMSFTDAHQAASSIVYGRVLSVDPADQKPSVFREADIRSLRTFRFKVLKQWKGKPQEELRIYFWDEGNPPNVEIAKLRCSWINPDREMLLFVHEEEGKNIVTRYWGKKDLGKFGQDSESNYSYKKSNYVKALDAVAAGMPLNEVNSHFSFP